MNIPLQNPARKTNAKDYPVSAGMWGARGLIVPDVPEDDASFTVLTVGIQVPYEVPFVAFGQGWLHSHRSQLGLGHGSCMAEEKRRDSAGTRQKNALGACWKDTHSNKHTCAAG